MGFLRLVALLAVTACRFDPSPATGGDDQPADAAVTSDGQPLGPWLAPWTHRKAITLLAAQIEAPGDGALTDFPVAVALSDPEITAAALADGSDIVFTAADAITPLDREIESFAAGELVAWVKIPTLSATTDTKIYVYYGNPSPQAPQAVWTSYLAVYHLQQDPGPGTAGDIRDASGHHDGTADASMTSNDLVAGQLGRAIRFDGSKGFIDVTSSTDVGSAFTISLWMNLDTNAGNGIRSLVSNSQDGSTTSGFRMFANSNGSSDHVIRFETGNGIQSDTALTPANTIAPGQWTHVAAIVDRAAGNAVILVNGAVANAADSSIRNDFGTASDFELGRMEGNNYFDGMLDEIEIASTNLPVEWIVTAFNNQHAPAAFYTVGTEEVR